MKLRKLNIAVFSSSWLGVSETFIFRQLQAIEDNGLESIVLTQRIKDSALKKGYKGPVYYKKMDKLTFYIGVIMRKLQWLDNGWFASEGQKRVWRSAIKTNKTDLIHAHYGPSGLRILKTAKKENIPLVTTFHGNDASSALNLKGYVKSLNQLFKYSYIITVSDFLKNRLISLGASEDKVFTHYIGTNLEHFKYTAREAVHLKSEKKELLTFLQVSNFVEKKGHKYTIKAFNNFLKIYPNAQLILGGDGVLKKEIEDLVKELNITSKVRFLGAIPPKEVAKLMETSDVFLHHSITAKNASEEGIPTVIMEAMASGIPVVSSKHAGIPELVAENCGYLAEEKNVDQYTEVLVALLKEDTLNTAKKAKERVYTFFDIKKQNKKLIGLYHDIIESHLTK